MSTIKFTCEVKRVAIVDPSMTQGRIIEVGDIKEFTKTDTEITAVVELRTPTDDAMIKLFDTIEKNPACLRIAEVVGPPKNHLIVSPGGIVRP